MFEISVGALSAVFVFVFIFALTGSFSSPKAPFCFRIAVGGGPETSFLTAVVVFTVRMAPEAMGGVLARGWAVQVGGMGVSSTCLFVVRFVAKAS